MGRRRRPAAETRAEIEQIAQSLLVEHGPDGVKLDDVAAAVGVSRQAVLHHFGSREGLMRAVVEKAWVGLFADLAGLGGSAGSMSPDDFLDLVDEVTRRRGNARLGAWLLLSGKGLPAEVFEGALTNLPDAVEKAGTSREDAENLLLMVGATMFGDAIFGTRLRQALGVEDSEERRQAFRRWLARRLWPNG